MLSAATTAAEILEESLQVSQTQIEWELVYIQLTQQNQQIGGGNYAYIIYSVSIPPSLHREITWAKTM